MAEEIVAIYRAEVEGYKAEVDKLVGKVEELSAAQVETQKSAKTSFNTISGEAAKVSPVIGKATAAFGALKAGIGRVVMAMNTLKGALIASGIGLLVVVIGSVTAAATRMQGVMDKLRIIMAGVSAAVAQVKDRLADLGAGLIDIISGNFTEGFRKIGNAFTGIGDQIREASRQARILEERLITLERSKLIMSAAARKAEAQIAKLSATLGDETVAIEKQIAAQREILRIKNQLSNTNSDQLRQLIAQRINQTEANEATDAFIESLRGSNILLMSHEKRAELASAALSKIGLSYSNVKDDLEPLIELINEYTAAEQEKFDGVFRINSRIRSLQNQLAEEEKERQKEADRIAEEARKEADAELAAREKAEAAAAKRREEISRTLATIQMEIDEQLNTASEDILRREVAAAKQAAEERASAALAGLNLQLLDYEQHSALMLDIDASLKAALEDAESGHQERLEAIRLAAEQAEEARRREQAERQLQETQQYIGAVGNLYASFAALQEAASNRELAALQNRLEQGLISEEQYDQERRKIARQQAADRKQAALFEATINGITAVINAFKDGGPVLAAITGIAVAAQIAAIASEPLPQFEHGGVVKDDGRMVGRRHSQGGILIEAEGGEHITRRKYASEWGDLLESVNKGTGMDYINKHFVAPAVSEAMLKGMDDIGTSAALNGLMTGFSDMNLLSAIDRHRQSDADGFKYLAREIGRHMSKPKRGYA
jgi:hypothetical protein